MQITSLPYRKAIVEALKGNVNYQSKNIGVFEGYYMKTTGNDKAILNGNVEAYIILLNQTSNEARSNKCNRNNNDSIQIQINTVWPAGKGGSEVSEEIANVVLSLLFPDSIKTATLTFPNSLDLWKCELLSSRNLDYDLNASRVWVTQLTLEAWISQ